MVIHNQMVSYVFFDGLSGGMLTATHNQFVEEQSELHLYDRMFLLVENRNDIPILPYNPYDPYNNVAYNPYINGLYYDRLSHNIVNVQPNGKYTAFQYIQPIFDF